MPVKNFKCKQCGNCCRNLSDAYETYATEKDFRLWKEKGRKDILEWVEPVPMGGGYFVYKIWIRPNAGCGVLKCPWLKELPDNKYACLIYDVRPEHCKSYPLSEEHAEKTGCKGLNDIYKIRDVQLF